jgi:serine/threonine protein kinase
MSFLNLSGRVVGPYLLKELIGKGGMGVVYRAERTGGPPGDDVAVKIVTDFLSPNDRKRFKIEARTSASLQHPNIVQVYDYGEVEDIHYVAMRLLPGGSLSERIEARRKKTYTPLPLSEVLAVARQIAAALDYAHSRGVIHRDIKPGNLLFDERDVPYIVDFGVAKLTQNSTSMTTSGSVIGTLPYVAPELLRGDEAGPGVDQYALAATVYAMLTGHTPFEADSPFEVIHNHLYAPPQPLTHYRADLPAALMPVLTRALAKAPGDRFRSVSAFAEALEAASAGRPLPVDLPQPRKGRAKAAIDDPTQPPRSAFPSPPRAQAARSAAGRRSARAGQGGGKSVSQDDVLTLRQQTTTAFESRPDKPSSFRPRSTSAAEKPPRAAGRSGHSARQVRWIYVALLIGLLGAGVITAQSGLLNGGLSAADRSATATAERCRAQLTTNGNVRTGPGTEFESIRAYPLGWTADVIGVTVNSAGQRWWQVYVASLDRELWVSDDVADPIGDCADVPDVEG